jgi:SAM-dependent methyltransferase
MCSPYQRELKDEDLTFLAEYTARRRHTNQTAPPTATTNVEELMRLRQHVLALWRSCLEKASVLYRCVQQLTFLQTRVNIHWHYPAVMETLKANSEARFLDLGCGFGTDTRRLIVDGWKEENVVAVDVIPDFWKYGLELYADEEVLKTRVLFGNVITDQKFVKTLHPLGPFDHVWAGNVLHVLNQENVEAFVRVIFELLNSGGTFFGRCVGSERAQIFQPEIAGRDPVYLHSPQSLEEMLRTIGFVDVEVQTGPADVRRPEQLVYQKIILFFKGKKPN